MRSLAMFAGGAVAAILVSRILPPLMAQAGGTARARAGYRDGFDTLIQDHRKLLSLLTRMEHSPDTAVVDRTQLLLRLKRQLAAHARAEEDVIYPLLHDRAHETGDARRLYDEHADMKIHLFTLEETPKDDPRWIDTVRDLKALIEQHIRQEEDVDFPKLRRMLDRRETAHVSGNVQREKALIL
ncbi:MAG TPA: hemerythrin domain-containing protein [Arenibaculum sp.]|nr:hemerythrin domain-containing protein [Arenibaculum sp.]